MTLRAKFIWFCSYLALAAFYVVLLGFMENV